MNYSDETLSAYLDGELTADEQARLEQLLAENAELRLFVEELRSLRSSLQELPRHSLEPDFAQRVLRRAEREILTRPADDGRSQPAPAGRLAAQSRQRPFSARALRPAIWAALTIAAGLLIMTVNRRADEPQLAKAPEAGASKDKQVDGESDTAPPANEFAGGTNDAKPAPLAQPPAASDEAKSEPSLTATAAQSANAGIGNQSDMAESLLVVQCDITSEAASGGVFDELLGRQEIALMPTETPDVFTERQPANAANRKDLRNDVDIVYIEGGQDQISGLLQELSREKKSFPSVTSATIPALNIHDRSRRSENAENDRAESKAEARDKSVDTIDGLTAGKLQLGGGVGRAQRLRAQRSGADFAAEPVRAVILLRVVNSAPAP